MNSKIAAGQRFSKKIYPTPPTLAAYCTAMRQTPRPPISTHRLARLSAWARLWLVWVVGVCAPWSARGRYVHRRDLDRVARGLGGIVVAHTARRVRVHTFPSTRNRHGRLNPPRLRPLIGARLRRALQGRDWPQRLAAIVAVMRDLEGHICRLARRLRRGLTRLRVIDLRPEAAPRVASTFAPAICGDDSS